MDNTPSTTAELLRRIQDGWDAFQAYLSTLTPKQLTQPTDAAGWRVQDHVMHLVIWEDGIVAVLNGQSRQARMGVDDATWKSDWHADDFFTINDGIFQRNKSKSVDEVLAAFKDVHQRMMKAVGALSESDLMRPYNSFVQESKNANPIWGVIASDTYEHYAEHRPWIEAIVAGK